MNLTTSLRNADLTELVEVLRQQADVKYDVVVPAARLRFDGGNLVVAGGAAHVTDLGVGEADAILRPTDVFDEGVAERLGIPRAYLRRLRDDRADADLLDANVNGWLAEEPERRFLVRGFHTMNPDDEGIARALLSDRYRPIDNLDVLLAALDGVRQSGVEVQIDGGDLTERRMSLRVYSPDVAAQAPRLLARYRSPFDGRDGKDLPVVFAGFVVRNGENGGAAFTIVPRVVVEVCRNGMTITKDALRHVHLGGRLDEGQITWSDDTQRKNLELVTSQARDAVRSFLSADYVEAVVADVEERAEKPVDLTIEHLSALGKTFGFQKVEQESILSHFIRSGDPTAGGVAQAVTATAQSLDDPDRAAELEDSALAVLDACAS